MARRVLLWMLVTFGLAAPGSAHAAPEPGAPSLVSFSWSPRSGSNQVLNFTLGFDAPAGLASGELRFASRWHSVLGNLPLGNRSPGAGTLALEMPIPGAATDPWELIGVTLVGADGKTTVNDFCGDLLSLVQTREPYGTAPPNIRVDCFDPGGWIVYTLKATDATKASAQLDAVGVTKHYAYSGAGWILENSSGAVVTSTKALMGGDWKADDVSVTVNDQTVVVSSTPDPTDPRRIANGIGNVSMALPGLGATYRLAAYFAARPGAYESPWIILRGSNFDVVSVQTGPDIGIAYGADFRSTVVACNSVANRCNTVGGSFGHTAAVSHTSMFAYFDMSSPSVGVTRVTGPSAPPNTSTAPRTITAGKPGAYRYLADASVGEAWGKFVVAWADMPITPQ